MSLLPWRHYLHLRALKRRYGQVATVPTTLASLYAGSYFVSLEAAPGELYFGFLEPVWAYGLAALSCIGVGWLSGPVLGSSIWRLTHARLAAQMQARDAQFFQHIKRNRADPSRQSVNNPVPDHYGERVDSIPAYRRWLRDQAVYKRKATFGSGM